MPPLVTLIASSIFLDEAITAMGVAGMVLVTAGMAMGNIRKSRWQRHSLMQIQNFETSVVSVPML